MLPKTIAGLSVVCKRKCASSETPVRMPLPNDASEPMLQVEAPHAGAIRSPNTIKSPMAIRRRARLGAQSTVSFFAASPGGKRIENEKGHAGESLIYFALEFALASRGK
jgi:hypothetical protein